MSLDALRDALPGYAKDTKLNLGSVIGNSTLPAQQLWGTVLACAVAARNPDVLRSLESVARERLPEAAVTAAKAAASVMAMNNIYYRAKHFIGDEGYDALPARLRMQVIGDPGVSKTDFELWCLAVSAITGCGACVQSHESALRAAGTTRETIHEALRIAAVVHAAAVTMGAEVALV